MFNAYDTLLPELESPPGEAVPADADAEAASGLPEGEPVLPLAAEVVAQPTPDLPATSRMPAAQPPDAAPQAAVASEAAAPDILLEPIRLSSRPPLTWRFWLYLLFALLLTGLLALQAVYFLRAELVAAVPATRSALVLLCRPLHCAVPLPRQLGQAAIAASTLEHDLENKSRVRLTVLLANRTGQDQAWPQILLTLSDVRQAPVARQVFRPQAYLPKGVPVAEGFAAGGEREIRLDLDIGNLVASGYAVSLAYP